MISLLKIPISVEIVNLKILLKTISSLDKIDELIKWANQKSEWTFLKDNMCSNTYGIFLCVNAH